ncbi:hypothetical protein SKAU_G00133420 [Synaphobranchus kaupii]|uniref:Uncharacterized protein n=1 Tax=Synaphobranchus kaupii TaxID=118154 RepID=A0A9Q1FQV1_SYNKA|nr:hypothetical protein SKAU_G00133420 [Synaphobranchus kaupii]
MTGAVVPFPCPGSCEAVNKMERKRRARNPARGHDVAGLRDGSRRSRRCLERASGGGGFKVILRLRRVS